MQKYNLPKKSSKRIQNPSRDYKSIANLKFPNTSQNIIFQESSYKNRPIVTQGPKSLELQYSIMNLNTRSLPCQARSKKLLLTTNLNKSCFEYMLSKVGYTKQNKEDKVVKHTCGGAQQMQYGSYFFYGFKGTSFSLLLLVELTTCQMHFNLVHFVWNPLAQQLVVGSFKLVQIVLKMQTRVVFNIGKI